MQRLLVVLPFIAFFLMPVVARVRALPRAAKAGIIFGLWAVSMGEFVVIGMTEWVPGPNTLVGTPWGIALVVTGFVSITLSLGVALGIAGMLGPQLMKPKRGRRPHRRGSPEQ